MTVPQYEELEELNPPKNAAYWKRRCKQAEADNVQLTSSKDRLLSGILAAANWLDDPYPPLDVKIYKVKDILIEVSKKEWGIK